MLIVNKECTLKHPFGYPILSSLRQIHAMKKVLYSFPGAAMRQDARAAPKSGLTDPKKHNANQQPLKSCAANP